MSGQLLHLYGPFSIQSYGLLTFVGVVLILLSAPHHWLCKRFLGKDRFFDMVGGGVIAGVVGARVLHYLTEPGEYGSFWDIFKVWEGGLSSLGVVLGCALFIVGYLLYHNIPLVPVLDLIAVHTPILHIFIRLGCFTAGCCGGIPTDLPWATTCPITGQAVHPTQLYSAALYVLIFGILYFLSRCPISHCFFKLRPGQLVALYLFLSGLERCAVDFWRGDRVMTFGTQFLSVHQWIALGISLCGVIIFIISYRPGNKPYERI